MTIALLALAAGLAAQQTPPQPPPEPAPQAVEAQPAPASAADAEAAIAAGLTAYRQRHLHQAEIQFRKAVEADPQNALAHYYLGYTLYKIAEPSRRLTPEKEKAKEEFAKAFELDPQLKPDWGRKAGPKPSRRAGR